MHLRTAMSRTWTRGTQRPDNPPTILRTFTSSLEMPGTSAWISNAESFSFTSRLIAVTERSASCSCGGTWKVYDGIPKPRASKKGSRKKPRGPSDCGMCVEERGDVWVASACSWRSGRRCGRRAQSTVI